jgi:hypothetical protein
MTTSVRRPLRTTASALNGDQPSNQRMILTDGRRCRAGYRRSRPRAGTGDLAHVRCYARVAGCGVRWCRCCGLIQRSAVQMRAAVSSATIMFGSHGSPRIATVISSRR